MVNIDGREKIRNRKYLRPIPDQAASTRAIASTEVSQNVVDVVSDNDGWIHPGEPQESTGNGFDLEWIGGEIPLLGVVSGVSTIENSREDHSNELDPQELSFQSLLGLEMNNKAKCRAVSPERDGDGEELLGSSSNFWPTLGNHVWQPGLTENKGKHYGWT